MVERVRLFEEAIRTLRHDLRNLQGAVAVMAEHFEKQGDERGTQYTDYLDQKIGAMVRLSERTQRLGKLGGGAKQAIDLGLLVSLGLDAVGFEPPTKPWVELPGATVMADEDLSVVALSEVIDNAVRTAAEVRITGEVREDQIIVRVRDFGRGIEPSAVPQLLAPLIGARRDGGASLGLALAQEAMVLQGGNLEVLNSQHGVTVALTWPRS